MASSTLAAPPDASYGQGWGLGAARCLRIEGDILEDGEDGLRLLPIPDSFMCPLSLDIMRDPVLMGDGCTYEREYIEDWIRRRRQQRLPVTSPSTGLEMQSPLKIISLIALSEAIETYLSHRPELKRECTARRSLEEVARVLQNDLDEKRAVNASIQDELQRLRAQVDDLAGAKKANEELLQDLCKLRVELEREQAASQQLRCEMAAFREEVSRLRPKADEVDSLREEHHILWAELKDAQAKCTDLSNELALTQTKVSSTADKCSQIEPRDAPAEMLTVDQEASLPAEESSNFVKDVSDDEGSNIDLLSTGYTTLSVASKFSPTSKNDNLHQLETEELVAGKTEGRLPQNDLHDGSPRLGLSGLQTSYQKFETGEVVVIVDLKAKPELNGTYGSLVRYDEEAGRWQLRRLASGVCIKIRSENIRQAPLTNIEVVIAAMRAHPGDVEIQRQGCIALQSLAVSSRSLVHSAAKEVIEVTIAAIRAHPGDVETQTNGCGLLFNLAWSPENQGLIAAKGGIEVAVAAMRAHPGDVEIQWIGSALLSNLSSSPENHGPIAAKGGIEVAVAAMRAHPGDVEIQQNVCGLLSNLCSSPENQGPIAANGGIEVAVAAMRAHPGDVWTQQNGSGLLYNLVANPENSGPIAANGGIEVVVAAMRAHPGDVEIQWTGSALLCNLALNPENQGPIAAKGGIEVAVAAMRAHPGDVEIQKHGCELLLQLLASPEHRGRVAEGGGIKAMVAAVCEHPGNADIQGLCSALLGGGVLVSDTGVYLGEIQSL